MFLHVQNIQTLRVDNPYFFKVSFFYQMCTIPSKDLYMRILRLMIRREKGFELMKIVFMNNLSTFGSNMLLTFKIMKFENVTLTKVIHICNISICNQNIFITNMHC